jgi:L-ascorbate metabolism protein UlaG (beta-lactamase superfamily)
VLPDLTRHDLAAVWLGHATVLMRVGRVNILTDPVLSERIGPSVARVTIGIPRLAPPPAAPSDLPPIDLVLLSHAHFDHLDKPTLRAIASRHTTVITARRTARLVPPGFGRVIELDWHEVLRFRGLHLAALRPAHWGARTALDRDRGYNSYVVRGDPGGVLFAGDTAFTRAFDGVRGVRLAAIGIGASRNWEHAHATPEQAWAMFEAMGDGTAERLLPIHHSTYPIGEERPEEPMERLLAAAGRGAGRVIRAEPGTLWSG